MRKTDLGTQIDDTYVMNDVLGIVPIAVAEKAVAMGAIVKYKGSWAVASERKIAKETDKLLRLKSGDRYTVPAKSWYEFSEWWNAKSAAIRHEEEALNALADEANTLFGEANEIPQQNRGNALRRSASKNPEQPRSTEQGNTIRFERPGRRLRGGKRIDIF